LAGLPACRLSLVPAKRERQILVGCSRPHPYWWAAGLQHCGVGLHQVLGTKALPFPLRAKTHSKDEARALTPPGVTVTLQ
jgi:hypothetical protein